MAQHWCQGFVVLFSYINFKTLNLYCCSPALVQERTFLTSQPSLYNFLTISLWKGMHSFLWMINFIHYSLTWWRFEQSLKLALGDLRKGWKCKMLMITYIHQMSNLFWSAKLTSKQCSMYTSMFFNFYALYVNYQKILFQIVNVRQIHGTFEAFKEICM